jgi:hypothetical protein
VSAELQYRRAMSWFPRPWLDRNGEDMLGTLLDVAGDRDHVPARERIGLRVRGLATRLGLSALLVPSVARDRAASTAFATGFAFAVAGVVFGESRRWAIEDRLDRGTFWSQHGFGAFTSTGIILYAVWLLAFVTMLLGLHRITRGLLIASIPTLVATGIVNEAMHMWARPDPDSALPLLALTALVAASGRLERRTTITLTVCLTAGVVVVNAAMFAIEQAAAMMSGLGSSQNFSFGPISWVNLAVAIAAIVAARLLRRRSRTWSIAIAVGAVGWFWLAFQWFSQTILIYIPNTATLLLYLAAAATATILALRARGIRLRLTLTRD